MGYIEHSTFSLNANNYEAHVFIVPYDAVFTDAK